MKNFIISVLSLSFLISCSSGGVGGNDFIEPYNTIITSQPYYYKSVNVENSECKSIKKLIFDDDGSGSVGNICDVIFLNNQSNFTWSLNDTILSIVMDDVVIDLEILEINDTLLLFDDNFYYNNEWSSNIPSYEEQGWSGLSFKHDSTYVIEYTHVYDPGNDVNNEMYIYQK